jgi:hypothetical protein
VENDPPTLYHYHIYSVQLVLWSLRLLSTSLSLSLYTSLQFTLPCHHSSSSVHCTIHHPSGRSMSYLHLYNPYILTTAKIAIINNNQNGRSSLDLPPCSACSLTASHPCNDPLLPSSPAHHRSLFRSTRRWHRQGRCLCCSHPCRPQE